MLYIRCVCVHHWAEAFVSTHILSTGGLLVGGIEPLTPGLC